MNDKQFDGRHVLITGGGGALGQVLARCAATRGARVTLVDRVIEPTLAQRFDCLTVDLADASALAAAVGALPPVDCLFAVAGGFAMGESVLDTDGDWRAMFAANVDTLRGALRAVVPGMLERQSGAVVTVGALSAREGKAQMSAYTAAKAVVMNLTESLAAETARRGVRVNAVLPSIIDTPANRAAMPEADFGAWVAPEALADVMLFLASDAARGIHGVLLPVTAAQA